MTYGKMCPYMLVSHFFTLKFFFVVTIFRVVEQINFLRSDVLFLKAALANTELMTIRSRHQREVSDMKEQLHRANLASDRDQALREKVFNEAKAEVMALSKKVRVKVHCFEVGPDSHVN